MPGVPSRSCTNHQHKTHKTELREVHYPWHPLYGQEIPVRLERRWKNGWVARCDAHSGEGRRGFDTPAWMLDRAVCSTMKVSPTPFVDTEALTELRRLLDRVLGKEEPSVVEGGYRLDAGQGGAYAQVTTPIRATGVVSPAREDSRLEDAPRNRPRRGVTSSDADVSGSLGAPGCRAGTGRVEP